MTSFIEVTIIVRTINDKTSITLTDINMLVPYFYSEKPETFLKKIYIVIKIVEVILITEKRKKVRIGEGSQ